MNRMIFAVTDVIYRFIVLNILWLVFLVVGLGIFGFMPATVALFRSVREWIKGETDLPLFRSFLIYYKTDFISSNLIGALFMILFYIIYVNASFVSYFYDQAVHLYIYIAIFSIGTIIVLSFLNTFSVMAHFKHQKTIRYFKSAIGLVFARPAMSLLQLIWLVAYILIAINYPKLFMSIGISVFAYVLMSLNYSIFKKYHAV
ncbi:Uncharacterized membrane protein YesL [Pelagirhabdus alkalitolerans]|uniref:Uncharacterized membrane protein YesL n=2 Tax=Pelagirhabdus alkalitolerans TaxID=1612202 RepID=A0A1G6GQI1_9BACI|nr:Uncharacterized membrane protein YesL [Pelagirhabdus alkalitolerans]